MHSVGSLRAPEGMSTRSADAFKMWGVQESPTSWTRKRVFRVRLQVLLDRTRCTVFGSLRAPKEMSTCDADAFKMWGDQGVVDNNNWTTKPKNSYLVFSYFRARACWLAATFFSFFVECCRAVLGLVQSRARPVSVPTTRLCRCAQTSCSQAQQAAVAVLVLSNPCVKPYIFTDNLYILVIWIVEDSHPTA